MFGGFLLEKVAKFFSGLESDRIAGRDFNFDAGLGIAANSFLALLHLKDAKPTQLNALAFGQRPTQSFDHRIDGLRGLDAGDIGNLRDLVHDISLDHLPSTEATIIRTGCREGQLTLSLLYTCAGVDTSRIDVWLKLACVFKSRSEAAVACTGGHVRINDGRAKPAALVKVGDVLELTEPRFRRLVVLGIPERSIPKAEAR